MMFEALKIFPEYIKWMLGEPKEISRTPQFLWKADIYHYIAILSYCSERGKHAHKSPPQTTCLGVALRSNRSL